MILLRSARLTGRPITRADWPLLEALLADRESAAFLAPDLEDDPRARRAAAERMAARLAEPWAAGGVGPYVWSLGPRPIGYAGLRPSALDARAAWEALWGLAPEARGRGFATEAAAAALAAEPTGLALAWTLPENRASRAVMSRLGMVYEGEAPWRGRRHVVYRLAR